MPRKPKGTKPIAKTSARMSRKAALTSAQLEKIDAYWRASNYLTACQLYLLDNPLLKEPLQPEHIKKKIVGHWGTCPGQNFIYTHLNRVIVKDDLNMIYLSGPGHGGNAMVAHTYMEGTYSEVVKNRAGTALSPPETGTAFSSSAKKLPFALRQPKWARLFPL